jgi:hypothetical protein
MIERIKFVMENKIELTIEELEAQYKALGEEIKQKKQTAEEEKKKKLAEVKAARMSEIEAVGEKYVTLIEDFIHDYGSYEPKHISPYIYHLFF